MQRAGGCGEREVVEEPAVAGERLGADAGERRLDVGGLELGHVAGGGAHERTDLRTEHFCERDFIGANDGDVRTARAERGRCFEADEARADHDDVREVRVHDEAAIRQRAQRVDMRQRCALDRQSNGLGARREHERIPRQLLTADGDGLARAIDLGPALKLGHSESNAGGRKRTATLADACEALIGAVFIDGGYRAAATLIERLWQERMLKPPAQLRDAKTMLQEWAQGRGLPAPVYREVERTGPHHNPKFRVAVDIPDKPPAEGLGPSKRAAEQAAAAAMLTREGVTMDAANG